jgi:hypothetical protein
MAIVRDETGREHGLLNRDITFLADVGAITRGDDPKAPWILADGYTWEVDIDPLLWDDTPTV